MLDGEPIVVIATGFKRSSANPKTGDMLRTWILRRDVAPFAAIHNGADVSRAFDGPEWLFAAMYSNCCGVEQEIEQRRDDLEEEMTMLEERQTQVLPEKD
jgi:hypothetical protein